MKIVEGNSYVCIKEWKDTKGRPVSVGAICYATKRGTLTGNAENIYSDIEPLDDYGDYFTLFEESPYNKERRELRERYAGIAMGAIISNSDTFGQIESDPEYRKFGNNFELIARASVIYANALIEELKNLE